MPSRVRQGEISGEFGRAMFLFFFSTAFRRILFINMARPDETDMSPKRTNLGRLGINLTQIRLNVLTLLKCVKLSLLLFNYFYSLSHLK